MDADLVHNRREALATTTRDLTRLRDACSAQLHAFDAHLQAALREGEAELARREQELQRARAALAAASEEDRAACQRRVDEAERQVAVARQVVETIRAEIDRFRSKGRTYRSAVEERVLRGQAMLRTLDTDLDRYLRASSSSGLASGGLTAAVGGAMGVAADPLGAALGDLGLELVGLDAVDFSDNPIVSWTHASPDDIRWALERWDTVVSKVVARGGTRDELEARDVRDGTLGTRRRLGGVWDVFLGESDRITVSIRPDGSLDVEDGRHRIEVARSLGIRSLPMRILRPGPR